LEDRTSFLFLRNKMGMGMGWKGMERKGKERKGMERN
jgi:hypothetical protein